MLPLVEAIIVSQTVSSTEAGSIPVTITLSGTDSYVPAAGDAATVTFISDRHHNVVHAG